ncbi:MAG: AgmX/PglI C-terminal domain-containing protein, partial [Myxococcales bacterium]|nr:AgmX/PglI C-terminal domain-containing protein [Myxococcales bacterium]
LFLEDDAVARMHAVLEITASDVRLVDLGSAAGTSINGRPVVKSAAVQHGDALALGPYRLEVDVVAVAPASVATVATVAAAPSLAAGPALAAAPALAPRVASAPAPAPASPRAMLPIDTRDVESDDRHVAQVVASYGSTVLDVQHVGQVQGRRRQAPLWIAAGGLMLLAGAGIMASEVTQDWEGYQQARAEATALGRPEPAAPGHGLGGLGLGLALMGLVPFGFGVVRRGDVGLERYTLGERPDATFHVPTEGLPQGESFPLVRRDGDGYVLQFTAGMRGHVTVGGQHLGFDQLVAAGHAGAAGAAYAYPLPAGAKAHVEHAGVSYEVSSVARGKAVARKNEADRPFWIYNAASFAVMGGLLALIQLIPEEAMSMNVDELTAENRYVGYINQPDEQPEEQVVEVEQAQSVEEAGGTGQRHAFEEGKMGKPDAQKKSGLYAMKGPRNAIPQMARNFDPELRARSTGILGMMEQESGHFLASPYGAAFAVGNDDDDIWGGLTGTEVGEASGVGGLGLVGTGRGGGGNGEGTIGLGNMGLINKGGGGGDRSGYGRGKGTGFGPRGPKGPQIKRGHAKIHSGTIDKDIIRRIVRNHHNEVRHCYNQGLSKDPNLQGRVAVMFTIGSTGTVPTAAVSETTLKDRSVAN